MLLWRFYMLNILVSCWSFSHKKVTCHHMLNHCCKHLCFYHVKIPVGITVLLSAEMFYNNLQNWSFIKRCNYVNKRLLRGLVGQVVYIKQTFMSRNTSLPSLDFTLAVPSVRKFVRLFPEHQWVFFQRAPVSSTVPELTSS